VNVFWDPDGTPRGNYVCPAARPLLGTSCSFENVECFYCTACDDTLSFGPCIMCSNGYWRVAPNSGEACGSSSCPGF
jgi:hypothetical protein